MFHRVYYKKHSNIMIGDSMIKIIKWLLLSVLVLILVVGLSFFIKNQSKPSDIGLVNNQLSELKDTPNGVSSTTAYEEKKISPLELKISIEESKEALKTILATLGDNKLITEDANYLHYVFESDTMGFKDDVEFYFDFENKVIHYRSQSRVGVSDMGVNLLRYHTIFDRYMSYSK